MNDAEREMWVDNDENLYEWWKSSRMGKTKFIRENREDITAYINAILSGNPDR